MCMCISHSIVNIYVTHSYIRNKAVADGAVSFYLDRRVSVRVAKWTYGTNCAAQFCPLMAEHRARLDTVFTDVSGQRFVPNAFKSILAKVCLVLLGIYCS